MITILLPTLFLRELTEKYGIKDTVFSVDEEHDLKTAL